MGALIAGAVQREERLLALLLAPVVTGAAGRRSGGRRGHGGRWGRCRCRCVGRRGGSAWVARRCGCGCCCGCACCPRHRRAHRARSDHFAPALGAALAQPRCGVPAVDDERRAAQAEAALDAVGDGWTQQRKGVSVGRCGAVGQPRRLGREGLGSHGWRGPPRAGGAA